MSETNIPVTENVRSQLRMVKAEHGETYSEAIERLLEAHESDEP